MVTLSFTQRHDIVAKAFPEALRHKTLLIVIVLHNQKFFIENGMLPIATEELQELEESAHETDYDNDKLV